MFSSDFSLFLCFFILGECQQQEASSETTQKLSERNLVLIFAASSPLKGFGMMQR